MTYLIQPKNSPPFLTNWFDYENHYNEGDIVYNLFNAAYTKDGKKWEAMEEDNL